MDVHENAWDAHCEYHNAKNEQLLQQKTDRLQAAGDGLAEEWERELRRLSRNPVFGADAQTRVQARIEKLTQLLAAWTAAKEMK